MVKEMLETLRRKGWSDLAIGRELDIPRVTVFRWRKGAKPLQEKIVELALRSLASQQPVD